ncbi:MAG: selenocysteine-specific translation elongation factor [Chloroflexi bacterium]|nr:selenocysteine-specific translation elongation factor [Chloroflexota bacterium]MCY3937363.1 selenocysteine-specific translation elongation factor [Chloroflexota bacterium]
MFTIGTAGHIDHGKSALVNALTGIDPDRLPEEKSRGMTIDLGFAWLTLPSGRDISIVDVPGHERFIRNMVAGAGGIDAALLVIAGDEGVMPQTREHLAILDVLGIDAGLIVITKCDLVEPDWLELVAAEALEVVEGSSLDGSPIATVSSTRRTGLDRLLRELDDLLDGLEQTPAGGRPRLPVDRAFSVSGYGTVVTGTLIDGPLKQGQGLEVLPSGVRTRVRGIQSHKTAVEELESGSRAAVNLSGVEVSDVPRGSVLAVPGDLRPSRLLDTRLSLLRSAMKPLKNGTEIAMHTGTAEVRAAVRLLDVDALEPGSTAWVQMRVRQPVSAKQGDRFVVRQLSPAVTIGGGEIVAPKASRLRRHDSDVLERLERLATGDMADSIALALERSGPMRRRELAEAAGGPGPEFDQAMAKALEAEQVVHAGNTYFESEGLRRLVNGAKSLLAEFHEANPLRSGLQREELRNRLGLGSGQFNDFISHLELEGVVQVDGAVVRLTSHRVELTEEQERAVSALLEVLRKAGINAPPLNELAKRFGVADELLDSLGAEGRLVRVASNLGYEAESFEGIKNSILELIEDRGKIDVAGLRDHFASSRKYCLPILEYLDSAGITRRVGDFRVKR